MAFRASNGVYDREPSTGFGAGRDGNQARRFLTVGRQKGLEGGAYGADENRALAAVDVANARLIPLERIRAMRMKRLLLVVVLVTACLLLFAAPASAIFYNSQQHTAYVTHWGGGDVWMEWVPTASDPNNIVGHWATYDDDGNVIAPPDPIPHDYNVVITAEWFDTRLGATLIPAEWFHTMAISKTDGPPCFRFAIKTAAGGLRYWSPAYQFDPTGIFDPNRTWEWARDWWVPLGKLPAGHYSGWVTNIVPRAFPTWEDQTTDAGDRLPLCSPFIITPSYFYDNIFPAKEDISFTVQ